MTTPDGTGGFEYTDDSVIARVAFDVPASAVSDLSQITQVMGAMRTQLEAVARAQEDWIGYLQAVPAIAERANQAFRDQITLMERLSYLQSEIGPTQVAGPGGGYPTGTRPGAGPGTNTGAEGGSGYSTAAPPGYVPPFKDMTEGTGQGPNLNVLAERIGQAGGDRAAEEILASRSAGGINPARVAMLGGAATRLFGLGDQSGQQAGQPSKIMQAANWVQSQAQSMADNGGRIGQILAQLPGVYDPADPNHPNNRTTQTGPGGPGGPGGPPGGPSPTSGDPNWPKRLARAFVGARTAFGAAPMPIKVGAGLALGATAFNKVQDIGERITEYQQLGSQEGGDYATGFKREMEARIQAIDPFINTAQARESILRPMQAGFQGESRNDLRELLQSNFKELGISFAQTMAMQEVNMRGVENTDANVKRANRQQDAALNVLKELAGDGGNTMALQERTDQLQQMQAILNSLGMSQESSTRSAIATQQGFDDSIALRKDGARITGQTMRSGTMMAMAGQRLGVTGYLPNAMPAALEEAGYDADEIRDLAAAEIAKAVSGLPKKLNRIAAFQSLMAEQGVELDWPQAKDLYEKVSGDRDKGGRRKPKPSEVGNRRAAELDDKNRQSNWNPITGIADTLAPIMNARTVEDFKNLPRDVLDGFMGRHSPSQNALDVNDSFRRAGRLPADGDFAPAGQRARDLPTTMREALQQVQQQPVTTRGTVQGEVRIVVDQQGRVSAPPVISLTGTQRAVNAGVGSSTLNNAPPSEPRGANTFPGGG